MYKQKIISLLIIFFILTGYMSVYASTDEIIIHENIKTTIVTEGVIQKTIERFSTRGWLNINVLEVDLANPHLNIEILTDIRGISNMTNVVNLAKQNDMVAAINGDFFQRLRGTTNKGSSIGTMIKDGQLLSTPAHEKGMATIALNEFNEFVFDYWTYDVSITAPNGETAKIKHINKYDALDSIILYNRHWDTYSIGSKNNIVEVVVVDGTVTEIRKEMPPVKIPENGYILCSLPKFDPFLIENLNVGDTVTLNISTHPDYQNIKMAMSGGAVLVRDGNKVPLSHNIAGIHPRTAVGTDATGKKLFMVTVDGRQLKSNGMTLSSLADFLIDLGIYNGVNLDGGGSTAMVSKSLGTDALSVVSRPSDGWLRNISNGLGVRSSAPQATIAGLVIETVSENVFINTSRTFSVRAYDQHYNAVSIDSDKIQWHVSGVDGYFKDNTFYPTSVGRATITASYQNTKGTYIIDVLSAPAAIEIEPKRLNMQIGDIINVSVTGKNRFGYGAPIDLVDVTWDIADNIVKTEKAGVRALSSGVSILTATIGEVITHAAVAIDFGVIVESFEKPNGRFIPYPSYVVGSYSLSDEQKRSGNYAGKLSFDFTSEHNDSKAAYLKFDGEGIPVHTNAIKIGMWVHAESYMEHWLRGGVRDRENNFHRITFSPKIDWDDWQYIEAEIPEDIEGPIHLTRLYIVQIDPNIKNKGAIYFDDISFVYPENKIENIALPKDVRIPDDFNMQSGVGTGDTSFRFTVFGDIIYRKTLLEHLIMTRSINTFNRTGSLSAFVGNINPHNLDGLDTAFLHTSGYYMFDYKGSTFLHLDNSNDGFRKTDPNQWVWFKNNLPNINHKNVFIFLPKPLIGEKAATDSYESQLFRDILTEELAKKGHNVFVFYNDDTTDCTIYRGVRYISVSGIKQVNLENISSLIKQYQYIEMTVNGDEVSYQIKRIFN